MFGNKGSKEKFVLVLVLTIVAMAAVSLLPGNIVLATPGSGVTSLMIVSGNLGETIPAKFKTEYGNVHTDVSKTAIVKYTVAPGGVFGWHQHGGPLWVIVESGNLSFYESDDPSCTAIVFPAGSAFMDPGNHMHNARNEGTENLVLYAVFMLPEGGQTRIDVPNPGTCGF